MKTSYLRKIVASLCLLGLVNTVSIRRSEALVVGLVRGSAGTAIVGVAVLLFIPILGLILNQDQANYVEKVDFDQQLPFLANTVEGEQIKELIIEKVENLVQTEEDRVDIQLDKSHVLSILDQGDFTPLDKEEAVKLLCY